MTRFARARFLCVARNSSSKVMLLVRWRPHLSFLTFLSKHDVTSAVARNSSSKVMLLVRWRPHLSFLTFLSKHDVTSAVPRPVTDFDTNLNNAHLGQMICMIYSRLMI